jgi:hypothetical protein
LKTVKKEMPRTNFNRISTNGFSNHQTWVLYNQDWPNEPEMFAQCYDGNQCGGCSFFAPLNEDWGICCHQKSRHHLETVFEHFTCPAFVNEGWGPHSFSETERCECGGVTISRRAQPEAENHSRQTAKAFYLI